MMLMFMAEAKTVESLVDENDYSRYMDMEVFDDEDEENVESNENDGNVEESHEDQRILLHEFPEQPLSSGRFQHMNRIACAAHKLDKLGSKDALKARNDSTYKEIHDRAFNILERIWALKASRLSAEVFYRSTGKKLVGPHRIRWMKTFDAVSTRYSHTVLEFLVN